MGISYIILDHRYKQGRPQASISQTRREVVTVKVTERRSCEFECLLHLRHWATGDIIKHLVSLTVQSTPGSSMRAHSVEMCRLMRKTKRQQNILTMTTTPEQRCSEGSELDFQKSLTPDYTSYQLTGSHAASRRDENPIVIDLRMLVRQARLTSNDQVA
ncbi:hypothetical protein RRG08_065213 [Elysia crispata]|uniref:Uncharacterized protein n=1 Tax=Elysia crispata TaxID=231223 RepID=A0AAE0YHQ7_9GAST|nr:hypothetical protein RRG08_065213 [Elysia crispata]